MADEPSKAKDAASKEASSKKDPRDSITAHAVGAALKADKGAEAKLVSFKVVDFTAKGDNYVSLVTSVVVDYCLGDEQVKEVTYVVKCNPQMTMETMGDSVAFVFEKETIFYEQILPELNSVLKSLELPKLSVPQMFYSSAEPKRDLIFLEDMRKKGFKMHDRKKGLDMEHATLVIKELARLHASSKILFERAGKDIALKKYGLNEKVYDKFPQLDDMYTEWFKSSFVSISDTLAETEGYEKASKSLKALAPQAYSLLLQGMKPVEQFAAICHGDCWSNNLLFRYENEKPVEVCLVDLQVHGHSSVAADLQTLLTTSFDGPTRKRELHNLLSLYYSELENCAKLSTTKLKFSKEELHEEYKAKNMYGLTMALISMPIILAEGADTLEFDGFTEDQKKEFVEKEEERVRKMLKTNPLLRPRLLDMIDEKTDEGILN